MTVCVVFQCQLVTFIVLLYSVHSYQLLQSIAYFRKLSTNNKKYCRERSSLRVVQEITSVASFDEVIKEKKDSLVIIDYSTTWCGPCKVAAPKFAELSERYPQVVFLKCIGDVNPDAMKLMKREGVRSVPSFHFWKSAERFEVINGIKMDEIESIIKEKI